MRKLGKKANFRVTGFKISNFWKFQSANFLTRNISCPKTSLIFSNFQASEEELKTFVALFNDVTQVPAKGADIEGVHYVVPRTEESLIFGKKENTGFFAVKTKSAVLIAVYEGPNEVAAQVRKAVESMQTYLNNAGY